VWYVVDCTYHEKKINLKSPKSDKRKFDLGNLKIWFSQSENFEILILEFLKIDFRILKIEYFIKI